MLFRSSGFFAAAFVVTVAALSATWPAHSADVPAKPAAAASAPATAAVSAPVPAVAASAPLAAAAASAPTGGLDSRIQDVKGDVIKLNRDLLVLEEELLFPANTQVALFVSMDVGKLFSLDSVQIKLDDKLIANYLYTPLEVEALHRGGVQRVYLGNLKAGQHEIVAFFTGQGPHERDYKRGATVKFDKGTDPKYIELQIKDATAKLQPEFEVKVWQ
ncbi:MAG: AraC family transcriptional regulator [Burkholderiaceae bacterium]